MPSEGAWLPTGQHKIRHQQFKTCLAVETESFTALVQSASDPVAWLQPFFYAVKASHVKCRLSSADSVKLDFNHVWNTSELLHEQFLQRQLRHLLPPSPSAGAVRPSRRPSEDGSLQADTVGECLKLLKF